MEMNLDKNIFSQGQTLFTQDEFNRSLNEAKAEIMAIAIQTTKQAIGIEREACAEVCKRLAEQEDEGELSTALFNAAIAIMNRMRQLND
jgi:type IV pilus biogenesis protein CpaD/CtpE